MGRKDLGVLYDSLFGLEIITVLVALKWDGQNSKLIQVSATFTIFSKHRSLENRVLRCLQEMWLGVTNFIWPYLHQIFIDSHGLNGYRKPLKRPFDEYQSHLEAINNGQDIRQINW